MNVKVIFLQNLPSYVYDPVKEMRIPIIGGNPLFIPRNTQNIELPEKENIQNIELPEKDTQNKETILSEKKYTHLNSSVIISEIKKNQNTQTKPSRGCVCEKPCNIL